MISVAIIFFSIFGPSLLLYGVILYFKLPFPQESLFIIDPSTTKEASVPSFQKVLIVIAHPDDETMFFAPAIIGLVKDPTIQVHLLCLSTGNQDNLGETRKKELFKACEILGIPEERIIIMDEESMPDGQDKLWAPSIVATAIERTVSSFGTRTVLSFDKQGVSGHINHISARAGVGHLLKHSSRLNSSELSIAAYELESYLAIAEVYFTRGFDFFTWPNQL
ncbi:hypothetical protein DSO57_1016800 [Entomophthora muscae]|uniref:Uncharacterized protein n=2 Tax=Entomophthora muscae TaxID=34485 RepID=A0ACC2STW7_9FUNG|nr:hypothetical protein DSO57_1016800 [Entomophthora muscae]